MVKYAVIGTGWITQSFIDGAKISGRLSLEGVCSRDENRGRAFAEKNGAGKVFTSVEKLAQSDVEAVYIASPNAFHTRQTVAMLEAGKHVICEKPVTITPAELVYLQNLAEKNGLVYVEAIMYMFNPVRDVLRNALGEIGAITSANLDFSQLSSKYPAYKRGELPNIFNPEMATGCLEDLGIYCVYPAVDLFGEPKNIKASASFMASGADGSGGALFEYDGLSVNLTYSKLGQSRAPSQIFGDKGTVLLESVSKLTGIKTVFNDGSEKILCEEVQKEQLMGFEADGFADIIENREKNKEFYGLLRKTALGTSRAMQKIRSQAGIEFKYKPLTEV
ncbi:MAG: Gfo/Idh/MocA family oxidoreductase [Clostridia bacterium]|nr:Gfo/Idh/MocA family oxidoreductase [Clostridia bacterium]